ncbi:MAG: hypothetical protein ACT4PL_03585 [Phycisphaerales bacterium]
MAKARQIVLLKAVDPRRSEDGLPALGTIRTVTECLARYNTAPDGAPAKGGGIALLFGPGLIVEMPTGNDDVVQLMVTMTDEDFSFPVLQRVCREQQWTMMDPESGRRFGP